jgi:hypothetical protein
MPTLSPDRTLAWAKLAPIAEQALRQGVDHLPREVANASKVETTESTMFLMVVTLTITSPTSTGVVLVEVVALGGRNLRVEAAIMRTNGRVLRDLGTLKIGPEVSNSDAESQVRRHLANLEQKVGDAEELILGVLSGQVVVTQLPQPPVRGPEGFGSGEPSSDVESLAESASTGGEEAADDTGGPQLRRSQARRQARAVAAPTAATKKHAVAKKAIAKKNAGAKKATPKKKTGAVAKKATPKKKTGAVTKKAAPKGAKSNSRATKAAPKKSVVAKKPLGKRGRT